MNPKSTHSHHAGEAVQMPLAFGEVAAATLPTAVRQEVEPLLAQLLLTVKAANQPQPRSVHERENHSAA